MSTPMKIISVAEPPPSLPRHRHTPQNRLSQPHVETGAIQGVCRVTVDLEPTIAIKATKARVERLAHPNRALCVSDIDGLLEIGPRHRDPTSGSARVAVRHREHGRARLQTTRELGLFHNRR
jgi:hypothetical protein